MTRHVLIVLIALASTACAAGTVTGPDDPILDEEEVPNGFDLTSPDMRPIGPKPIPVLPAPLPVIRPGRRSPIDQHQLPR